MPVQEDIQSVLFVCSVNAVRSPMAEALMKHICGRRLYVQSCGVNADDEVDVFAVAALKEVGIDLSQHEPRSYEDLPDGGFDMVIALSEPARDRVAELFRTDSAILDYWETPDVSGQQGSRDEILRGYRDLRDLLSDNIRRRFAPWVTR